MKRLVRWSAWVGLALCVVALAFGGMVRLLEPPPWLIKANLDRLKAGMTKKQIEAILGSPPHRSEVYTAGREWVDTWVGEGGTGPCVWFTVYKFAGSEELRSTKVDFSGRPEHGPLGRLRSLFGW